MDLRDNLEILATRVLKDYQVNNQADNQTTSSLYKL